MRHPRGLALLAVITFAQVLAARPVGAEAPFRRPHMHRPGHGCQIAVGPVTVPRGTELTECTYVKFPGKRDMAVNRERIKLSGGSDHTHRYRPAESTRDKPGCTEHSSFRLYF